MVLDSFIKSQISPKKFNNTLQSGFSCVPAPSNAILKHPSCSCIVAVHIVPVLHLDTTVTFRALSRPESSPYDLVKHFCGVDEQ